MIAYTHCVAFAGIHVLKVNIEVQLSPGLPSFTIVGLADKAIAESRERVRAALHSIGLSLPPQHITVNLAPADVIKEGTHYDLPIAMALMAAMEVISLESIHNYMMLGELGLDGTLRPVSGVLPASIAAVKEDLGFICPMEQGSEAAWSGNDGILAPHSLLELIHHFKGVSYLNHPKTQQDSPICPLADFKDIKGQESAKRVMEIAALGGHNVLMSGPPGSGKSMLASRLPSIMSPMTSSEILEVSQIHSVAGLLRDGRLINTRPFRAPHHSSSMPALVGGGLRAKPGEISLAHRGILFLDELPEFSRATLESLRQPLETGTVSVARANAHVTYPAQFQLIAAMNPCRCGYYGVPGHECTRAPKCVADYQAKISGPMLDRFDLYIEVPMVSPWELASLSAREDSATVRNRVISAKEFSKNRFNDIPATQNRELDGTTLEEKAYLSHDAKNFLIQAAQTMHLSGRGYHRMIRVARTIADLELSESIQKNHMAEALSYRKPLLTER